MYLSLVLACLNTAFNERTVSVWDNRFLFDLRREVGASTLEGLWSEVPSGGDSEMKFFKVVVELP